MSLYTLIWILLNNRQDVAKISLIVGMVEMLNFLFALRHNTNGFVFVIKFFPFLLSILYNHCEHIISSFLRKIVNINSTSLGATPGISG